MSCWSHWVCGALGPPSPLRLHLTGTGLFLHYPAWLPCHLLSWRTGYEIFFLCSRLFSHTLRALVLKASPSPRELGVPPARPCAHISCLAPALLLEVSPGGQGAASLLQGMEGAPSASSIVYPSLRDALALFTAPYTFLWLCSACGPLH